MTCTIPREMSCAGMNGRAARWDTKFRRGDGLFCSPPSREVGSACELSLLDNAI